MPSYVEHRAVYRIGSEHGEHSFFLAQKLNCRPFLPILIVIGTFQLWKETFSVSANQISINMSDMKLLMNVPYYTIFIWKILSFSPLFVL